MALKKQKKKVVFLGGKSIGFYCLQELVRQSDTLGLEVVAILSNSQTKLNATGTVESIATQYGIPVLAHEDELLSMPKVDFLISVQYHRILKKEHLKRAKQAAINLHMAPLPEYRGCNQFSFAIADEAKIFGTTLHLMKPGVDDGDILFEKRFKIPADIFVKELYDMTEKASKQLFKKSLSMLISGDYTPTPQASLIAKRGTKFIKRKDIEQLKCIDLKWSQEKIDRHIRATYFPPFEPPYMLIKGEKYLLQPKKK
ncbi:MAG: hypothetical protein RL138_1002 [Bacteroidota bacterium]